MWTEPILHVDMDAFFVEVERLTNPSLRGRPVAVGGKGPRGVIASASYEARRHGVRSAQPTLTAMRLCPSLEVVPPSHARYRETSIGVFSILRSFTPLVEGLGVDEAFLDVRGLRRHYESPVDVARGIRSEIGSALGLPASVGVAASKLLAKLASEQAKPDGVFHIPVEAQLEFLHPLPAVALAGVGPATMAGLERLGVETVGDIAELPEATLSRALGPTQGGHLHRLARGVDPRPVEPDSAAKSISVEETYESDLSGRDVVETAMLAHAHRLSSRLRRAGMMARTITLKARYADFTTVTRSRTLPEPVHGSRDLYRASVSLLDQVDPARPLRLLGLAASSLEPSDRPRQLAMDDAEVWERVEAAVAEVRQRFGDDSVSPARLIDGGG